MAVAVLALSAVVATSCAVPNPGPGGNGFAPDYVAPSTTVVSAVAYGPLPEQVLDLHLPAGTGPFPVMIWVHGGGWVMGDRLGVPQFILRQVSRAGIAVVSIDYRLVTTATDGSFVNSFPAADNDVDRAVRFVKANAATWHLDPARVLLGGSSAGGQLAALAAVAPGAFVDPTLLSDLAAVSPRVSGVLDFVGISDFSTFGDAGGWAPEIMTKYLDCPLLQFEQCDPAKVAAASVVQQLDASDPPAFLAYGAQDNLVVAATQGVPLARKWAAARGGVDPSAPWFNDVFYEQAGADHNGINAATLNVRSMETWIDWPLATT